MKEYANIRGDGIGPVEARAMSKGKARGTSEGKLTSRAIRFEEQEALEKQ